MIQRFTLAYLQTFTHMSGKRTRGLFFVMFVMLGIVGCGTVIEEIPTATQPTAIQPSAIPQETAASVEQVATPRPQPTMTSLPAETTPTRSATVQPSPPPDATVFSWASESLITYDGDGISRLDLETGESQPIVPIVNQGTARMSDAQPAYDGREVVYWFVDGYWFVVKAVNTLTGYERPLLAIEDAGFTTARGNWLGQGRFFELAIWGEDENGVPLVKQWFLFDLLNDTIVGSATDRPGSRVCHTLASSPRTGHIATWCSFDSQFEKQENYLVIEANGESWSTNELENIITITYGIEQQIWAPSGNYVIVPSGTNATLVDVNRAYAYDFSEEADIYLNTYAAQFSPDDRFLSYEYHVCEFDNFCQRIFDLQTETIVWDSTGVFEPPTQFMTWSPDGRFFVLRTNSGDYQIIDSHDFVVVKTLPKEAVPNVIRVAWLYRSTE